MIKKIKVALYFPLWAMLLTGYLIWSFARYFLLAVKRNRLVRKIIFSDVIQSLKEKLTGRPKI